MVQRRRRSLRAAQRDRLPASDFAIPSLRMYPIDTIGRARRALFLAAAPGTHGTYRQVAAAVRRKWGNRIASVGPKTGDLTAPSGKRANRSRPLRKDEKAAIRRRLARVRAKKRR